MKQSKHHKENQRRYYQNNKVEINRRKRESRKLPQPTDEELDQKARKWLEEMK